MDTSFIVRRTLKVGSYAQSMRLSGNSIWVLCRHPRVLVGVTLDGFQTAVRIPLPAEPSDFDISSDGMLAAIGFPGQPQVTTLALRTARIERVLAAGGDARLVRFRSDDKQILVGNRSEQIVTILDTASGGMVVRLPIALKPEQFCFNPNGGQLFVSGSGMDGVVIVYPYRTEVGETLLAGKSPGAMAVSGSPEFLFVANPASGTVTVFDVFSRRLMGSVSVGAEPSQIIITPDNQYALILNRQSGDLAVIRIAALDGKQRRPAHLFTMIPVGSKPVSGAVLQLG